MKKAQSLSLRKSIAYHAGAWMAYVLAMYLVNRLNEHPPGFVSVVAVSLLFVLVFYSVLAVLQRFFSAGKYVRGAFALLGCCALLPLVAYVYLYSTLPAAGLVVPLRHVPFTYAEFFKNVVIGTTRFSVYAIVYYVAGRKIQAERARHRAERKRMQAEYGRMQARNERLRHELAALGIQLNPHTLYNALNRLYSRAVQADDSLAAQLLRLASLAEYAAGVPQLADGLTPVEREWMMLEAMEKLALGDQGHGGRIVKEVTGAFTGQLVPPFAFVVLFENALKYGDTGDSRYPIRLHLRLDARSLSFYCANKIRRSQSQGVSLGTGLANLRRRLQLLFGRRASLAADEANGHFRVRLDIRYE